MSAPTPAPVLPANAQGVRRLDFRALGTACCLQFRQPDERAALSFAASALGWLENFEARFSRFRPDSLISRINAAAGVSWVETDPETDRLLNMAEGLHFLTEGILDATMLPLLRVWDWKKVHERLPSQDEVQAALALTGWRKVRRRPGAVFLPQAGMGLDLGGFGKEYAVDRLALLAREHGVADCLIDLGRDIFALGRGEQHPFWHVGLEDGLNPGRCRAGLALSGQAIAASGDYARHFVHKGVRYGHILDPRTGWPAAQGVRSASVVAPSCVQAGAYSTAACILGVEAGLTLASRTSGVEASLQTDRGEAATPGFHRLLVRAA